MCEELAVRIILGSDLIDEFAKRVDVITQELPLVDKASVRLLRTISTDLHLLPAQPTLPREDRPDRRKRCGRSAGTR